MAYDTKNSKFLDKIKRACDQYKIESCRDLGKNLSLEEIELSAANELGLLDVKCIKNSRPFLDGKWVGIFTNQDNASNNHYDAEKKGKWDLLRNTYDQNKRFINIKILQLVKNLSTQGSDEDKESMINSRFSEIDHLFPEEDKVFISKLKENFDNYEHQTIINDLYKRQDENHQTHLKNLREKYIHEQYKSFIFQLTSNIKSHIMNVCKLSNIEDLNVGEQKKLVISGEDPSKIDDDL